MDADALPLQQVITPGADEAASLGVEEPAPSAPAARNGSGTEATIAPLH